MTTQQIAITGFIGRNLKKYLGTNKNITLHLILRENSNLNILENRYEYNICTYRNDFASLNEYFAEHKIDTVVHLATLYLFDYEPQNIDDLIDSNIRFGSHLREAMAQNNCLHFINAGSYIQNYFSDDYYGSCFYAATKQAMQDIIDFYTAKRNIKAITLKLFDIYGANDTREKFLNLLVDIWQNNTVLDMSPGEQKIRLTHIDDVCKAFSTTLTLIIKKQCFNKHTIYYVGAEQYSLDQIANMFENVIQ
jgi:nucleoside-diphosphate-sugar epimerase